MGTTSIEWADATWNVVTGCTKVSPGCKNCYAEKIAKRFWGERKFSDVRCHPDRLDQPLHWKKPSRIFVNSMSDLFHEALSNEQIAKVFNVIRRCYNERGGHRFIILTKRPGRMVELLPRLRFCSAGAGRTYFADSPHAGNYPLAAGHRGATGLTNVWLGVSCENQETADERIPLLLQTPAAHRFVSLEPLLGPIDLNTVDALGLRQDGAAWTDFGASSCLDWVIVGAESGPGARPCNVDWIRSIVEQCREAQVPVFVKQDFGPRPGKQGRIPNDLWIKEFPDGF